MKREYTAVINLNSIEKVKTFSKEVNSLSGLLKVTDGVFTVDGKSILGLFSLNLTNPVSICYEYDTDDVELLQNIISIV